MEHLGRMLFGAQVQHLPELAELSVNRRVSCASLPPLVDVRGNLIRAKLHNAQGPEPLRKDTHVSLGVFDRCPSVDFVVTHIVLRQLLDSDSLHAKPRESAFHDLPLRFTMLVKVPGKATAIVVTALSTQIRQLPAAWRRSLTWDRGKELAQHKRLMVDTKVQVYFSDPQSPWQRGTNENTNRLLRQYFPKGTDPS